MTVEELIRQLQEYPPEMAVSVSDYLRPLGGTAWGLRVVPLSDDHGRTISLLLADPALPG